MHGSSEAPDAPHPIYGARRRATSCATSSRAATGSASSAAATPTTATPASPSSPRAAAAASPRSSPRKRTRDAVLAALRARRCYATNGPRIMLQARLAGRPLGSLVPPGRQRLRAQVVAPGILDRIDVIRGPAVVFSASAAPGDEGREAALDEPLEDLPPRRVRLPPRRAARRRRRLVEPLLHRRSHALAAKRRRRRHGDGPIAACPERRAFGTARTVPSPDAHSHPPEPRGAVPAQLQNAKICTTRRVAVE